MLQVAIKVIKDHGAEWLSGMGAEQRYQSPFWHLVLKLLEIPVRSESQQEKTANNPFHVHGQNILTWSSS